MTLKSETTGRRPACWAAPQPWSDSRCVPAQGCLPATASAQARTTGAAQGPLQHLTRVMGRPSAGAEAHELPPQPATPAGEAPALVSSACLGPWEPTRGEGLCRGHVQMPGLAMATKDRHPRPARRGRVLPSSPILHYFPAPTICTHACWIAHMHTDIYSLYQTCRHAKISMNIQAHVTLANTHTPTRHAADPDTITHGPSSHMRLCFQPPVQTGIRAQPHPPLRVHEQTRTCADPDTRVHLVDKQTCVSGCACSRAHAPAFRSVYASHPEYPQTRVSSQVCTREGTAHGFCGGLSDGWNRSSLFWTGVGGQEAQPYTVS